MSVIAIGVAAALASHVTLLSHGAPKRDTGWFDAKTYEECILDKIEGANNKYAVAVIVRDCRKLPKFSGSPKSGWFAPRSLGDCVRRFGAGTDRYGTKFTVMACNRVYGFTSH